jgi:hypothetical protein
VRSLKLSIISWRKASLEDVDLAGFPPCSRCASICTWCLRAHDSDLAEPISDFGKILGPLGLAVIAGTSNIVKHR